MSKVQMITKLFLQICLHLYGIRSRVALVIITCIYCTLVSFVMLWHTRMNLKRRAMSIVRPTARWYDSSRIRHPPDSSLVWQPIGRTACWPDSPLVQQSVRPSLLVGHLLDLTTHWSYQSRRSWWRDRSNWVRSGRFLSVGVKLRWVISGRFSSVGVRSNCVRPGRLWSVSVRSNSVRSERLCQLGSGQVWSGEVDPSRFDQIKFGKVRSLVVDWGLVKMGQDTWILAGWVYRRDESGADMYGAYNLRKDKLKHTLQTCTFLDYYIFMSRK